jgi:hypothetical protein
MEILCHFLSKAPPKALNADLNASLLIVPVQYYANFMHYFLKLPFLETNVPLS